MEYCEHKGLTLTVLLWKAETVWEESARRPDVRRVRRNEEVDRG